MTKIWMMCFSALLIANEMEGPSLGWIWDSETKSLRRLMGIPGSLRNEAGVDLGAGIKAVWVSPGRNEAIVATGEGFVERRNLLGGDVSRIEGAEPDAAFFSPDGRKAGLWWKTRGKLQMWGEEPRFLNAKQLAIQNNGEILALDDDGVLRSLEGAWIGSFGEDAIFSAAEGKIAIVSRGALVRFDRQDGKWVERSRREDERFADVRQLEVEGDSVLTVASSGAVLRWSAAVEEPSVVAEGGVESLQPLGQVGFYLARGTVTRILFTRGEGQKLYEVPAGEVR